MPGSQGEGNQAGTETQPTWDTLPPGGSAGGEQTAGEPSAGGLPSGGGEPGSETSDGWESGVPGSASDGWETSNQVPGANAGATPPMPSERGLPSGQGGDGELDKALKDFDGGILAERAVIQARTNERAGASGVPAELPGSGGASGETETEGDAGNAEQQTASYEPVGLPSQNMPQRQPPSPATASNVPDDVPDARDDDIIARQLREAAMSETDPELREKLWEEYRKYKGA